MRMHDLDTQLQPNYLLKLPQDVLLNVCQYLFEAQDLLRLEQCSRQCRTLINSAALWNSNLTSRFGKDAYNDQVTTASSVPILKRRSCHLARLLIPAPEFQAVHLGTQYLVHQRMPSSTAGIVLCLRNVCWLDVHASFMGVLPGEYKVVWRMMRAAQGSVGMEHSDLQCSAEVHPVHPTSSLPEAARDDTVHKLQHFNSFPVGEWRDLPGGCVTVTASAHVHVRMWCHTGDWKRGLLWDYVKLEDVNKVTDPNRQTAHEPAPVQSAVQRASTAVEAAVDSVSTACRLQ